MRRAVIDIGTNSIRLAVAELVDGQLQLVVNRLAETRIGEEMGEARIIGQVPLARSVAAVQEFVQEARAMGVASLRITATSAVRDAANQAQVQQAILDATGVSLEVLAGETEARLSYLGASQDFLHVGRPLAVLDIGGGSTELVYTAEGQVHGNSVNLGAVRLLEQPALRQQMDQVLQRLKPAALPEGTMLIAVGGTNTCLMAMELGLVAYDRNKIHGQTLSRERVDAWCQKLLAMTQQQRESIPGMKKKRADIMPYGVMILQHVMELLEADQVTVSDKGIIYGLLADAFARS